MHESIDKLISALKVSEQESKVIKNGLLSLTVENALVRMSKTLEPAELETLNKSVDTQQSNPEQLFSAISKSPNWRPALEQAANEELEHLLKSIIEESDDNAVQELLNKLSL